MTTKSKAKPATKTKKPASPKASAPKAARSPKGGTKALDHHEPSPKEIANDANLAAYAASENVPVDKAIRAAKSAKSAGSGKAAKEPKPAGPKRASALDAAALVLSASPTPMRAKDMIAAMEAKGLWKSPGGKTPEATLYSAIVRDIQAKKKQSRFTKVDRGFFAATKGA
jgi:hypothetical protein